MATYEHEMQIRELRERVKELEGRASMAKVPEGWKLVPLEITREMHIAGHDAQWIAEAEHPEHGTVISCIYQAILDAAPTLSTLPKDDTQINGDVVLAHGDLSSARALGDTNDGENPSVASSRADIGVDGQEPVGEWVDGGNYPRLQWAEGYEAIIGDKLYASPQPKPSRPAAQEKK